MLKGHVKRAAARAGLELGRRADLPFGVRWDDDLAYYLGDRSLEVAIDVGAHFGETAVHLADRFPGCSVHSFEPVPDNYRVLEAAAHGRNIVCIQAAAGERDGSADIAVGTRSSAHSGFRAGGSTVHVPLVSLDSYAAEHEVPRIDLLKIDTEGHEPAVLRGARGLLERGDIDYVLCECEFVERTDEPHGDFAEIFGVLAPLGYRVVSFYTGGVDDLGWRWGNVLFRRPTGNTTAVACSPHQRVR